MRKLVALSALAFVCATSTAQAHSTRTAVKAQWYKANGVVRWIGHHARTTQYNPNPGIKHRWQRAVHYWVGKRQEAWKVLHPAPVIGHWAGWMCIHGGEGNGHNPAGFDGPLQMTTPWAGYSVNWNAAPMATVFAIAERVSAAHGFSYGWMKGQWPNTYPPCAGFF